MGPFVQSGTSYKSVMSTQDFGETEANPGPFLLGVIYRDANGDGAYTEGEGMSGVTIHPTSGSYYAVSSTSGGYAIPITGLSGNLQVTFSGGALTNAITKTVSLTGQNVKLDFEFNVDSVPSLGFVPGSARFTRPQQFEADLQGPVGLHLSIRKSEDLNSWTEIQQVTLTSGAAHIKDSAASQGHVFYRAVRL